MAHLKDMTPLAPVSDVLEAVKFFEETLGFETRVAFETYAYLKRDDAALRLISAQGAGMDNPDRQQAYYIDVDDVDALHTELLSQLAKLPETHHQPPSDTHYGQREFVVVYEALMLVFGQTVSEATP